MNETQDSLKPRVTEFLAERGYISKDGEMPESIDIFIKEGPANPTFVGTLDCSNPTLLTLKATGPAGSGAASVLAAKIAGGLQKCVSLG